MEKIFRAYYRSPVGYAEITANERAVLSVSLIDKPRGASAGNMVINKCITELDEYFKGTRKHFSVRLERRGTEFQRKVWEALGKIPFGKTCSYEDIAIAAGNPKAVRAVGLANGKNPHWIIVPCHRVIGKNNKLTGYAGGLDRKKWLLEHEKTYSSP